MLKRYIPLMIDIKSLREGETVEGLLAVRSKDRAGEGIRDYSNKPGKFFVITVGNSRGDIILKYWGGRNPERASRLYSSIDAGSVIYVKGRCIHDTYSRELVVSVNEEANYGSPKDILKKAEEGEFDPADFIKSLSDEEIKDLLKSLQSLVKDTRNPHLRALLEGFFEDPENLELFQAAPAARRHHHNYLGGLLEHTVNVAKLCETISSFYSLDRDLLITGALLHDFGKMREYSLSASIDVTEEGRLIGHLPITVEMVREKIDSLEKFPETLKNKVLHMILSHHGELEKGSPKEPMFPEAVALFHADYMDAFVKNTVQEIDEAGDGEKWIFSRSMGRYLHKGAEKPL